MNLYHVFLFLVSIAWQQLLAVNGCPWNCTAVDIKYKRMYCSGKTIDFCKNYSPSWKVARISRSMLELTDCEGDRLRVGIKLLLFVSRGKLYNYGKYEIVTVKKVSSAVDEKGKSICTVTLQKPIEMYLKKDGRTCVIAQTIPSFDVVSLINCTLTCSRHKDALGGILAFKAKTLSIDSTSKIDMSGKGFPGGAGGDPRGGGGQGGQTFLCQLQKPIKGKGGDISGAAWATNTDGIAGGGAADGPSSSEGSKGGPGGLNAGGGGGDSTANSDDGAGGGGGGGHFSGGGGGGGGTGCRSNDGGKGGNAGTVGTYAGGGGRSACPGGNGGDGGKLGYSSRFARCNDRTAESGNAGTAELGGGGGDSCGNGYGGGGGGGGLQFGSKAFGSRLSHGGGGGGGGGSAFTDDPNPGGRGGNGGGLVFLMLRELTLDGMILAEGQPGQCLNQVAYRSAPGGSGAGGSVVILTKTLQGDPAGKISVSGGSPVKCAYGAGGGGGGGVGRWVIKEGETIHEG